MTIGCLRISDMRCPTTRAIMSFGPPGGNGTINRIVLLGKSCATARAGDSKVNPINSDLRHFTETSPPEQLVARSRHACLMFTLCHCRVWAPAALLQGEKPEDEEKQWKLICRKSWPKYRPPLIDTKRRWCQMTSQRSMNYSTTIHVPSGMA